MARMPPRKRPMNSVLITGVVNTSLTNPVAATSSGRLRGVLLDQRGERPRPRRSSAVSPLLMKKTTFAVMFSARQQRRAG